MTFDFKAIGKTFIYTPIIVKDMNTLHQEMKEGFAFKL